MFITLGRVDRVFDGEQRKVIATSLYGHGQMTCEVLFSNMHVDVGQYLLIIVMDSDSFLRNYAIPVPRDANNVNDFSNIKLYYYKSEIKLENNRISMFIVDDGNEPYDDSEPPSESTSTQNQTNDEWVEHEAMNELSSDYYLNQFLSSIKRDKYNDPDIDNYKYDGNKSNYFDRNAHYTHVVLTGSNVEIGRYNKRNPYSTIFIEKDAITISKYDNQLPPPPVCENAESEEEETEEQENKENENNQSDNSSDNTESSGNETNTSGSDEWVEHGSDSTSNTNTSTESYDSGEWVEHSSPTSGGTSTGNTSVGQSTVGGASSSTSNTTSTTSSTGGEDETEEEESTTNNVSVPVVYLRSQIVINKDRIKVSKMDDDLNPRNEIVLTDNRTSLTYYYNSYIRTDFYMDCDNIMMNVYKMEDYQTLTECVFRENEINIIKYKEDGDRANEIYIDNDKIQLFSFSDGAEHTMFEMMGHEITFKSKGYYTVESAEVQIDGQPQPSPNPTGGFCQILYCPVTGLPHTTNKLTNPNQINIP